jgi:ubiquinone/menaquinone biosynthesis C-methylase UbiE
MKKDIQNKYNDLGGRIYDLRYFEEQQAKYDVILKEIKLLPSMIILDHGCGTGLLLERLEQTTVGLDISIELLKTARDRLENRHGKHLILADIDNLPMKKGTVDVVISVTVIQNTPDPSLTLKELQTTLKPDSTIVITTHKKTISETQLKQYINEANLKLVKIINDQNIQDFIAILINH